MPAAEGFAAFFIKDHNTIITDVSAHSSIVSMEDPFWFAGGRNCTHVEETQTISDFVEDLKKLGAVE